MSTLRLVLLLAAARNPSCRAGGEKKTGSLTEWQHDEDIAMPCKDETNSASLLQKLELMVVMTYRSYGDFWNFLAPSLDLFAPHLPIVVVLDDTPAERLFAKRLPKRYRIHFTDMCRSNSPAHNAAFCLRFYSDYFSQADYIGLVDADALFTTWVTQHSLFEGVRPRVLAEVGRQRQPGMVVDYGTAKWFKRQYELMCMTYLPQIYWHETFPALRAFMERMHGHHFDELMDTNRVGGLYYEVNILCNFALFEQPGWYAFHVQEATPGWREFDPEYQANVTKTLQRFSKVPGIHIAIHGPYMSFQNPNQPDGPRVTKCNGYRAFECPWLRVIARKMLWGFCRSAGAQDRAPADLCLDLALTGGRTLHRDLFRFEAIVEFNWPARLTSGSRPRRSFGAFLAAQSVHYSEVGQSCHGPSESTMRSFLSSANMTVQSLRLQPAVGGRRQYLEFLHWHDAMQEARPRLFKEFWPERPGKSSRQNHKCTAGIPNAGSQEVCCPKECGRCGGDHCDSRPGGAERCCGFGIPRDPPCTTSEGPPPCVYPYAWAFDCVYDGTCSLEQKRMDQLAHLLGTTRQ